METIKIIAGGGRKAADGFVLAVRILHGPDAGQLGDGREIEGEVVLGREAPATWVVEDGKMSRAHASLKEEGGKLSLHDLGSTNGTRLNGEKCEQATLQAGDVFRLGDTVFEYDWVPADPQPVPNGIIAKSAATLRALFKADRVASSGLAVLLTGESGTGKEVFAKHIHDMSKRKGRLVAVNCAALPSELMESILFGHVKGAFTGAQQDAVGLFAEAEDGTLFLDEIGEMPLALQPKLLRALESYEFTPVGGRQPVRANVRVVSATNVAMQQAVKDGKFRQDLYARLFGFTIELKPLRKRRADILPLFLSFHGNTRPLTADCAEALLLHDWPLNVRELRAVAQRLGLNPSKEPLDAHELHGAMDESEEAAGPDDEPAQRLPAPPKEELLKLLTELGGNIDAVATRLGRRRTQLYRWFKRYGISPDSFR